MSCGSVAGDEDRLAGNLGLEPCGAQPLDELLVPAVDLDEQPRVALAQLRERPRADHPAGLEDHDRVADPLDLLEVVRRDDDVDAELGADPPDQGEHVVALDGVEPVGRLVEQDERRVVRDRRRQLHALPLPGRHRPDGPEPLLAEPDLPERVARALDRAAGRDPVELRQVPDEVLRLHLGRQVVVLGPVPDALAHLDAGALRVVPEHLERARRRAGGARASAR